MTGVRRPDQDDKTTDLARRAESGLTLHSAALARRTLGELVPQGQRILVLGRSSRFDRARPYLEAESDWREAKVTYAETLWDCLVDLATNPPDLLIVAGSYEPYVGALRDLVRHRTAVVLLSDDSEAERLNADFLPICEPSDDVGIGWLTSALALGVFRQAGRGMGPPRPGDYERPLHGHVLVVDDEPMKTELIAQILEMLSLSCDTATSGEEALRKFSARAPDVVWTNWLMPEMSGPQLLDRLREDTRGWIPCILEGAHTRSELATQAQRCGADGILPCPFLVPEVQVLLWRAVELRQAFRFRHGLDPDEQPRRLHDGRSHDVLTGLLTRRTVQAIGWMLAGEDRGPTRSAALTEFDIVGAGRINDERGYGCSDRVVVDVAQRLWDVLAPYGVVARTSGGNFLAVLPTTRGQGGEVYVQQGEVLDEVVAAACRAVAELTAPHPGPDVDVRVTTTTRDLDDLA